jgi:hypothetical protein
MESYQGNRKSDQISGGGSYVTDEGMGHEVCNFHSHRGKIYGYVQPARGHRSASAGIIKLENIVDGGASRADESVKNVLVIWTATRPAGGTVVIGWYSDATVFREYQYFRSTPALHTQNGLKGYRIQANSENVKLLSIDERTIQIPRQTKGGMGQSNVWYGDSKFGRDIATEVKALTKGKHISKTTKKPRGTDPEHNSKVEKAAVNFVWEYYEGLGYSLDSVEKDNAGWDLEASQNKIKLRIEVKGLSGKNPSIEISPNEYKALSAKHCNYRLAIVTNALSEPKLHICRYSQENAAWKISSDNSASVDIVEKVAAQVRVLT